MISTTKASEERGGKGDVKRVQNKNYILVRSISWSVSTNQDSIIPHQVSSLKIPVKNVQRQKKKKRKKNQKKKYRIWNKNINYNNQETKQTKNGWPQEVHKHINTFTILIT